MDVYLLTALLFAVLTPVCWLAGMVSISNRDVKNHQFRMLLGAFFLSGSLVLSWSHQFRHGSVYESSFRGAFRLLGWLQTGLGSVSLCLLLVVLWSVREHVWMLHRRVGMFAFFSGMVASIVTVFMTVMAF